MKINRFEFCIKKKIPVFIFLILYSAFAYLIMPETYDAGPLSFILMWFCIIVCLSCITLWLSLLLWRRFIKKEAYLTCDASKLVIKNLWNGRDTVIPLGCIYKFQLETAKINLFTYLRIYYLGDKSNEKTIDIGNIDLTGDVRDLKRQLEKRNEDHERKYTFHISRDEVYYGDMHFCDVYDLHARDVEELNSKLHDYLPNIMEGNITWAARVNDYKGEILFCHYALPWGSKGKSYEVYDVDPIFEENFSSYSGVNIYMEHFQGKQNKESIEEFKSLF